MFKSYDSSMNIPCEEYNKQCQDDVVNEYLHDVSNNCPLCNKEALLFDIGSACAKYDRYQVTAGHILIYPKRHVSDYFDLKDSEKEDIDRICYQYKFYLEDKDKNVKGWILRWDCGEIAGQTISHAHLNMIPRRAEDVENPFMFED